MDNSKNPNYGSNSNSQNLYFDPNLLDDPNFQRMLQSYYSNRSPQLIPPEPNYQTPHQNYETPPQNFQTPQQNLSRPIIRNLFPNQNPRQISENHPTTLLFPMSQHFEQFPSTPGDGSSNRTQSDNDMIPTQRLGNDDEVGEVDPENEGGDNPNSSNTFWNAAEDEALVSGYLNCGGDPEIGTDMSKGRLWKEIFRLYERARQAKPDDLNPRNMKGLKSRWRKINTDVNRWVGVYGEVWRNNLSGSNEVILEKDAHTSYKKKYTAQFKLRHCWNMMKDYPKWDHRIAPRAPDSTGSGKRSQEDAEIPRPGGVKSKKKKGKEACSSAVQSMGSINSSLDNLQNRRGAANDQMGELLQYQKERDEARQKQKELDRRFRVFGILLAKQYRTPSEEIAFEQLSKEFM